MQISLNRRATRRRASTPDARRAPRTGAETRAKDEGRRTPIARIERARTMTDAATRALGRAKELSTTITLALFVLPLGVVAHAAAFAALPMQLASAMLRELTMSRGTDVRALLRGLYALALKPSLAAACAAEIKDDGEIFREYSRSSSEKIEAFRKMSEIEREKFIAACAKLKEEEQIRERLREQLNATRDELKRERAANFAQGKFSKGKEETGSGGVYLTTALLGVMLLYFHDMDTVHTLDKKLAASIPAFWMFVMTFKTRSVQTLCTALNLVLAGYFLHIVLDHRRLLGGEARVVA
jgi:hypothetical protein